MSKFDETLRNEAMDLAEEAFLAQLKRDKMSAVDLFKKAYEKEKRVAMLIREEYDSEPSRFFSFQSAASLAYNADMLREAEKMINLNLEGEVPESIAKEIKHLDDDTNFKRHLAVKEVELDDSKF